MVLPSFYGFKECWMEYDGFKRGDLPRSFKSLRTRELMFMTYERANWSIFQDAFRSCFFIIIRRLYKKKMFHLFKEFQYVVFHGGGMESCFGKRDERRLVQSLIINEQHLIQNPVIEHGCL